MPHTVSYFWIYAAEEIWSQRDRLLIIFHRDEQKDKIERSGFEPLTSNKSKNWIRVFETREWHFDLMHE